VQGQDKSSPTLSTFLQIIFDKMTNIVAPTPEYSVQLIRSAFGLWVALDLA
jgi:hypothetical protein